MKNTNLDNTFNFWHFIVLHPVYYKLFQIIFFFVHNSKHQRLVWLTYVKSNFLKELFIVLVHLLERLKKCRTIIRILNVSEIGLSLNKNLRLLWDRPLSKLQRLKRMQIEQCSYLSPEVRVLHENINCIQQQFNNDDGPHKGN